MSDISIIGTLPQVLSVGAYKIDASTGEILSENRASCKTVPPGREEDGTDFTRGLSTAHISRKVSGKVDFYVGGSLIKVVKPRISVKQAGGGIRGRVSGFSKNSRRRLMRTLGQVDKEEMPVFVTLTYPGEWDPNYKTWKRDLDRFLKRLVYKFEGVSGVWKLEPQKRGAPHYHLIIWGANYGRLLRFVADAWYQVVGSGDNRHLLAGTRVEMVRSWKGVMSYSAKYLGKVVEMPDGWENVGRYWGVFSRAAIPWAVLVSTESSYKKACELMRWLRRYAHIKARDYKSLSVFVNDPSVWMKNACLIC